MVIYQSQGGTSRPNFVSFHIFVPNAVWTSLTSHPTTEVAFGASSLFSTNHLTSVRIELVVAGSSSAYYATNAAPLGVSGRGVGHI